MDTNAIKENIDYRPNAVQRQIQRDMASSPADTFRALKVDLLNVRSEIQRQRTEMAHQREEHERRMKEAEDMARKEREAEIQMMKRETLHSINVEELEVEEQLPMKMSMSSVSEIPEDHESQFRRLMDDIGTMNPRQVDLLWKKINDGGIETERKNPRNSIAERYRKELEELRDELLHEKEQRLREQVEHQYRIQESDHR